MNHHSDGDDDSNCRQEEIDTLSSPRQSLEHERSEHSHADHDDGEVSHEQVTEKYLDHNIMDGGAGDTVETFTTDEGDDDMIRTDDIGMIGSGFMGALSPIPHSRESSLLAAYVPDDAEDRSTDVMSSPERASVEVVRVKPEDHATNAPASPLAAVPILKHEQEDVPVSPPPAVPSLEQEQECDPASPLATFPIPEQNQESDPASPLTAVPILEQEKESVPASFLATVPILEQEQESDPASPPAAVPSLEQEQESVPASPATAVPSLEQEQESVSSFSIIDDQSEQSVSSFSALNVQSEEEQVNDKRNESISSTGSLREEEMIRTKEELGATSLAFNERLRGAAFRRKMNLTRSRDSLAAKEREQRELIAASKASREQRRLSEPPPTSLPDDTRKLASDPANAFKVFKALPLPSYTGFKGHGGLSGVPKVEKKQTTMASSPMLGARRQIRRLMGQDVDSNVEPPYRTAKPSLTTSDEPNSNTFRARQLPPTTGELGHAGQVGVPKVPKRPATVPMSPLLGPRRKPMSNADHNRHSEGSASAATARQSSTTNSSILSLSSSALLGLDILKVGPKENLRPPVSISTPKQISVDLPIGMGYQPHSTARARQRADFEAQRVLNEKIRLAQEAEERQQQVKVLQKELKEVKTRI
jgi:hypothetical protein